MSGQYYNVRPSYAKLGMAATERVKLSSELLSGSTVGIAVGNGCTIFNVHRALICKTSPYFDSAIRWSSQAYRSATLQLPNTSVIVFKSFLTWLYMQTTWIARRDMADAKLEDLVDLYIFADQVLVPFLQNNAIEAMISIMLVKKSVPTTKFKVIWAHTTERSPLRLLMIEACAWCAGPELFNMGNFVSEKIAVDIMRCLWTRARDSKAVNPVSKSPRYLVATDKLSSTAELNPLVCNCRSN